MDAAERFGEVVKALERRKDVAAGRMFGSPGLKTDGKTFAMFVKGRLVLKLPRARVQELVDSGSGEPFDPGHGRLMREWVALHPRSRVDWLGLAREAHAFVRPK